MKLRWKLLLLTLAVVVLGIASYEPLRAYWHARNRPDYRLATVDRGRIVSIVNSTGTVKAVHSVQIGSFVSGPVLELAADFNDRVAKNQLLARIDPRIYEAAVARDRANLATRRADVQRVEALLQRAKNDEGRSVRLRARNEDYISDTEMDQFKFNRLSLEAELVVANSAVEQAQGNLANSEANLAYTEIRSPVEGIVVDRKIDQGQTLAAQFQTPELFVVAPDLDRLIHVYATVDEADIGLIRDAKDRSQPVNFTVDAYPDELFQGKIYQIRISSTTTQNVVTYPVVVEAPNTKLKLLPGMTASLSFHIAAKDRVLRIPDAALRFFPELAQVRLEDRPLLEGVEQTQDDNASTGTLSALERAAAGRGRFRRHVWIQDGDFLKAVEVSTGLSDSKFTEMKSGDLEVGQPLVTGIRPKPL